ncbi:MULTISPECIES: ferredoxin [Kosmotoga]|jgi:NADP-reducing hydrogenase subunit HndB|uniref:NADP-reducing hydrogenase, subunit B n=1 Tax=Kosmotoga olearia (strain ATCC BAA-1733 / DSM 21960 / TBF 19.5.1) TaxID=521045 RepID=C5CIR6_KOSOT|nr:MULTISPECIES: (2Fe-2S) ferredoxin domain-containing protein [Kosmotoga]ACR78907.1 NADP-reducing hydrogenase, subunit B [Kosmotoga olearia TBF 19.5.1]MDI3524363.1 NADP-reducing hydrogenase subunit HndB [Kosmotoga sp.]MDK2953641.1 NADP-reducing hydrogenase subunit HndB [Kosmotoga sp.]OAA24885.1 NADH dehydrogenase [Kosmotoga sp. DU53]
MAKIKSLEELMKIKENALKELKMRDSEKRGKIIVAMGTCGIAAGAKETLKAIVETLNEKGIDDIAVVQSGCFGLCDVEPTIEVHMENSEPIIYGHVTPAQAKRIIEQHVIEGKVVGDLIVKRGEL